MVARFYFFFKQKTAYEIPKRDWSSDVCSSDLAMHLPASGQIGAARKFLERFPWHRCFPQTNSAAWADTRTNNWGNWIWFPEGNPREDAPTEPRFFRRTFDLNAGSKPIAATLRV